MIQLAVYRSGGQARQQQLIAHRLLQPLWTLGRPADPIEGLGEAVEVVHQGRARLDVELRLAAAEPVGREHHQPPDAVEAQLFQEPGGRLIPQDQIRGAVGDKPDGGDSHRETPINEAGTQSMAGSGQGATDDGVIICPG
ncbi:hypothetical protein D3C79_776970 [compost metagenome]